MNALARTDNYHPPWKIGFGNLTEIWLEQFVLVCLYILVIRNIRNIHTFPVFAWPQRFIIPNTWRHRYIINLNIPNTKKSLFHLFQGQLCLQTSNCYLLTCLYRVIIRNIHTSSCLCTAKKFIIPITSFICKQKLNSQTKVCPCKAQIS